MPRGKVKFYDAQKGFGFLTDDDGQEVFVHASALPTGLTNLRPGTRVEFGVVDGKRGAQALSVVLLEPQKAATVRSKRKPPVELLPIVDELGRLLDDLGDDLRRDRYPSDDQMRKIAAVMRAVATDLEG